MKKITRMILLLAIVLLTLEVFAQSEHKSSNLENSSIAPTLPDGKNFSFGEAYNVKENSFIFGIIGDLIDGYVIRPNGEELAEYFSKDFNDQVDVFTHFTDKLEMPLYAVAGNHDISVPGMIPPYIERYGKLWYSFDYRGVHFIALNTEAIPGDKSSFSEEQVQWAIEDIAANSEARHTIVFMHKPAWQY